MESRVLGGAADVTSAAPGPPSVIRGAKSQSVGVDWFRGSAPVSVLAEVVGVMEDFFGPAERGKGRYFLSSGYRWGAAGVFYGDDAGHVVVDVPGGLLHGLDGDFEDGAIDLMRRLLGVGVKCTRVDVAVDFKGEDLNLYDAVVSSCAAGCLTGARCFEPSVSVSGGRVSGMIVRIGKRGKDGSGRYLRVYDKGLETKSECVGRWVRWEAEFSDDCAVQVASAISQADSWRGSAIAYALGVIDFREANGSKELKRRPRLKWFELLVDGLDIKRVRAERVLSNLGGWRTWIVEAVGPCLVSAARVAGVSLAEVVSLLGVSDEDARVQWASGDVGRQFAAWLGVPHLEAERRLRVA